MYVHCNVLRKMIRIRFFKSLGQALLIFCVTACSSSQQSSIKLQYSEAFESLEMSVTEEGIPRQKVFYFFQLEGLPSKRIGQSGIRGGRVTAWEEWQLPSEYKLIASKSTYGITWEVSPFDEGDSPFVSGGRLKEEFYHEPRLEPFFDSVVLVDGADEEVARFDVPQK